MYFDILIFESLFTEFVIADDLIAFDNPIDHAELIPCTIK